MMREIASRIVASQGTGKIHYKSSVVEKKCPKYALVCHGIIQAKYNPTIKRIVKRKNEKEKRTSHFEIWMKANPQII